MNSLPFHEIEDTADALDGDLSRYSVPIIFAPPARTGAVRVRRASKRQVNRLKSLLPGGVPRYLRVYDNGGESCDRYTAVFTGKAGGACAFPYLAMNAAPFHPQGFGQHGESGDRPCDADKWGFPPAMGRKNHLGRRIPFAALPEDCRKLVLRDYCELWGLESGVGL